MLKVMRLKLALCLLVIAGSAQASPVYDLSTDFGNGQIEFGSDAGFIDPGGFYDPDFTDGTAGTLLDFSFQVTADAPLGPRAFSEADLFIIEWLVEDSALTLRLGAFRQSNGLREGLTLVTASTGFEEASDTFCSSIGLSEPSENAACFFEGASRDVATSETLVVRPVAAVPEPVTLLLLGTGLAAIGLRGSGWGRRSPGRPVA